MRKATTRLQSTSKTFYRAPRYLCVRAADLKPHKVIFKPGFDLLWHTDMSGNTLDLAKGGWWFGDISLCYGDALDRHMSRMAYAASWGQDRVKCSERYGERGNDNAA